MGVYYTCCLLLSASLLYGLANPTNSSMASTRRLYVFFKGTPISDQVFYVKGDAYTQDGTQNLCYGEMVSSCGLSDGTLNRHLWTIDVDAHAYSMMLSLGPLGHESESPWSAMPSPELISGSSYIYSQRSYNFEKDSSWSPIRLSMLEFADYILSRIDPYAKNEVNGFLTYDDLYESFFSSLSDYDEGKAKQIVWTDQYLKKDVSLLEKWSLLKEQFNNIKQDDMPDFWPYLLGGVSLAGAILCFAGMAVIFYGKKY